MDWRRTSVSLYDEDIKRLDELCKKLGMNRSLVIREALRYFGKEVFDIDVEEKI